jgi:tRNA-modifying protein YgfZ
MQRAELESQVQALDEGRAFVAHERLRMTSVSGSEARAWLQDLITARVDDLRPFESRRSLLLTPTGRIRADFHVLGFRDPPEGLTLAQSDDQPESVAQALERYVLSSDVHLRSVPLRLLSVPSHEDTAGRLTEVYRPSVLGGGFDVAVAEGTPARDARRDLTEVGLVEAGLEAVEAWRIRRGVPRFPIDLGRDSLPAEAGLDDGGVIDRTKGCFLGQESVAKVRNLGHPTRVVLALQAARSAVAVGERVVAGDTDVGVVTSADALGDGTALLARVAWPGREALLRTASGTPLERR